MALVIAITTTTAGIAVDLAEADDLAINAGVSLISTTVSAVRAPGSSQGVVNRGYVQGAIDGISFGDADTDTGNSLTNFGVIRGDDDAVQSWGVGATIVNGGIIFGAWGINLFVSDGATGTTSTITNTGSIGGQNRAILHSGDANLLINNSGVIVGAGNEAILSTGTSSAMTINNTGQITGNVQMGGGNDRYDGRGGSVTGRVYGQGDTDTFIAGASEERFYGGQGFDRIVFDSATGVRVALDNSFAGTGAAAGDFYDDFEQLTGSDGGNDTLQGDADSNDIFGRAGNDRVLGAQGGDNVYGGFGTDIMFGGQGNDRMYGGTGIDTIGGGTGRDDFFFRSIDSMGDRINDFANSQTVDENIYILNTAVAGSGLALGTLSSTRFIVRNDNLAQDANDRFIFRQTDETLWYDENGSAGGGRVLVADLQNGASMNAGDIIIYTDM
jgi:Ca2+-binding RTX toxin-like protein